MSLARLLGATNGESWFPAFAMRSSSSSSKEHLTRIKTLSTAN